MVRLLRAAGLAMLLAACGNAPDESPQQPHPATPKANEELEKDLNDLGLEQQQAPQPVAKCPFWPELRYAYEKGTTCDTLKVQIRGSVSQCVPDGTCNPLARVAQYNAIAPFLCSAFCLSRGCHGYKFTDAPGCEDHPCVPGHPWCPGDCKTEDRCAPFIQTTDPNCECLRLPRPPPPSAGVQPVDDRRIG